MEKNNSKKKKKRKSKKKEDHSSRMKTESELLYHVWMQSKGMMGSHVNPLTWLKKTNVHSKA